MTDPRRGGGYYGGDFGNDFAEPEPRRGGSALPWVITALVIAIIGAIGVVAVMWLVGRGPSTSTSSGADDFTTVNTAGSEEDESTSGSASTSASTSQNSPTTGTTSSAEQITSPALPTEPVPSGSYPAGLGARGWDGALSCNASDDWVYAGSNGSDYALICVATPGGGLYYKGIFRGGAAEHDIAVQSGVGTPNAYFATDDLGDSTIAISGSDLYVYDSGGNILAQTSFGQVYAQ